MSPIDETKLPNCGRVRFVIDRVGHIVRNDVAVQTAF